MVRRIAGLALVAVALCPFLAACGPTMQIRMSVSLVDQSVRLSILLCANQKVNSISLRDDASPSGEWIVVNSVNTRSEEEMRWFTATLLETPPSFNVKTDTITDIADRSRYYLYVSTDAASSPSVYFGLSDLTALGRDQVWVATQRGGKAMNRNTFEDTADDYCE